jgi:hypothetical protein
MAALKALKCPAGCDRTARLVVPDVTLDPNASLASGSLMIPAPPTKGVSIPLPKYIAGAAAAPCDVCTQWDPGSFHASVDAGNGELGASARARLPKCVRWEKLSVRYPVCTVDRSRLLPRLRELAIVPPTVDDAHVNITIPARSVHMLTGLSTASCNRQTSICVRPGQTTVVLDPNADPTSVITAQTSCSEWAQVACEDPPFGIRATYTDVTIPDPAHTMITLDMPIHPPVITVDITKPEFQVTCDWRTLTCPPRLPGIKVTTRTIDTGFCISPRWTALVAAP